MQGLIFVSLPVWKGGINNEKELIKQGISNALEISLDKNFNYLTFTDISSDILGIPK